MSNSVQYEGVSVFMDGQEWIIPPLSVRQFRTHYKTLLDTEVTEENWQEKVMERLPIVLGAIQRNYPAVTEEQLLDMLDLRTFSVVIAAIANASRLKTTKPGE